MFLLHVKSAALLLAGSHCWGPGVAVRKRVHWRDLPRPTVWPWTPGKDVWTCFLNCLLTTIAISLATQPICFTGRQLRPPKPKLARIGQQDIFLSHVQTGTVTHRICKVTTQRGSTELLSLLVMAIETACASSLWRGALEVSQNCCCRQQAAVTADSSAAALLSCQRTQISHVPCSYLYLLSSPVKDMESWIKDPLAWQGWKNRVRR